MSLKSCEVQEKIHKLWTRQTGGRVPIEVYLCVVHILFLQDWGGVQMEALWTSLRLKNGCQIGGKTKLLIFSTNDN